MPFQLSIAKSQTATKLGGLKQQLCYSVSKKFRQGTAKMTCICSTMSGDFVGKI